MSFFWGGWVSCVLSFWVRFWCGRRATTKKGSLYWSKSMQRAYNKRHEGQPNKVQLNDAVFALHATFVSFLTLAQVSFFFEVEDGDEVVGLPGRRKDGVEHTHTHLF